MSKLHKLRMYVQQMFSSLFMQCHLVIFFFLGPKRLNAAHVADVHQILCFFQEVSKVS